MKKDISKKYLGLSEHKRFLHRPESYIGSVIETPHDTFIMMDGLFVQKTVNYIPAVLKLVDEIITNSVDEYRRSVKEQSELKPSDLKKYRGLTRVDVSVDMDGSVSVSDDGGIEPVIHPPSGVYVPTFLFGTIGTSTNYNDTEKRDVAGRNGLGAKAANIYSTEFSVVTCKDGYGDQFSQTWANNMFDTEGPVLVPKKRGQTGFTNISYKIDIKRFGLECIGFDTMKIIERRCVVAAATNPGLLITFNNQDFKFDSFGDFVKLFSGSTNMVHEKNSMWEVCVIPSEFRAGGKCVGFVNGAECNKGSHYVLLRNLVVEIVNARLQKVAGFKSAAMTIGQQYTAFINVSVINPTYEGQTKSELTTDNGHYLGGLVEGRKVFPTVGSKFASGIWDSEIIANLIAAKAEEKKTEDAAQIRKRNDALKGVKASAIRKLVDAKPKNNDRSKCVLWLFEGESAQSNFRNFRSAEIDGSYMLRGKLNNTLSLTTIQLSNKVTIFDIYSALGLEFDKNDPKKKLRYGYINIAADADVDGDCITCQIITLFVVHAPHVIEQGMLRRVQPPIASATKGKETLYFYDLNEFREAKLKGYEVRYLKGLGSMEPNDYEEMIKNPKLIQITMDEAALISVTGWMGSDSQYRKDRIDE